MKIPMNPNSPNIPAQQQTMVVVPSQINAEVRQLLFMVESVIDYLDTTALQGIKDEVHKGMAKRALFMFMDMKQVNSGSLDIEQAKTKQLDGQSKIIIKIWGQGTLNDMIMEYNDAVAKIKAEQDGVNWDKMNLN
jgi:hypothetical protein